VSRYQAAYVLSTTGESAQAQKLLEALAKESPEDTLMNALELPRIRAKMEIAKGRPEHAIELLRPAIPLELSDAGPFSGPDAICTRGEAYLKMNQGNAAAAEFQKILDHRGLAASSPLYPLARLGLARAYALEGDKDKARTAYQDFLALWKDADPELPILKEAKTEYTKLQ
jgi:tetratricopeptide (TPR) repeat protein